MIKYFNILFFVAAIYAIDCSDLVGYVENHADEYCIPENFYFNSSILQAAYFFLDVIIEDSSVDSEDWVGAFNGDVCVGARKWDVNECGNGVCEVPVLGQSDITTQGYMLSGQIPSFKIFRASDLSYHEANASEDIPWANFGTPIIDLLSVTCTGEIDECGICNGLGSVYECGCYDIPDSECDCNGNIYDECGMCGGNGIEDGECDCFGNVDFGCGCGNAGPSGCDNTCGSSLEFDECGICGGNGIVQGECDCEGNVLDCAGICEGDASIDNCGVCDNNSSNDCNADCNGFFEEDEGYTGAVYDECDICGGPGAIFECGCENTAENACNCDGDVEDNYGICGGTNECQGYDIPANTFTMLSNGQILYHSLSDIAGFQFTIQFDEYCGDSSICPNIPESSSINSISGGIIGSLVDNGDWTVLFDPESGGQVLGYSNNQYPIIAGCGLLMNIDYVGSIHDYINIYWSDENAIEINISYYETDELNNYIPGDFILKQNYPNPFNPVTFIEFDINQANHVSLIIYDLQGNQVKKLVDEFLNSDSYKITWDGRDNDYRDSPSGIYIASLEINGIIGSKKLTLIK